MPLGFRGFWGFGPGLSFRRVRTRVPGFVVWRQVRRCFPSCSLSLVAEPGPHSGFFCGFVFVCLVGRLFVVWSAVSFRGFVAIPLDA